MLCKSHLWKLGTLCLPIIMLSACSDGPSDNRAAEETQFPRVSVITAQTESVTVYDELPGRVSAYRTAEIRAQVGGIIQKKLFREGAFVEVDTPLFQIDPAPFAADADAAAAVLARADAELLNARVKYDRARVLSSREITSEESFNNATAAFAQAKANVEEARALLARRKLELSYATIRSPIKGVIGQSFMSEGGLASSSATAPLAIIQQIDQVYVDVRQSATTLKALRDTTSGAGERNLDALPVTIKTITDTPYGHTGKVLFSDISVDSATGSLGIRILVPNPEEQLLPGMYIRAMVPRAVYSAAIMVPQEAILRGQAGRPQLFVVGQDKTGARRAVELGPLVAGRYIVTGGLSAGETIVVLGQDRIQSGQQLDTMPFAPSAEQTQR